MCDIWPPCGARFSVQRRTSVRRGRRRSTRRLRRAPLGFRCGGVLGLLAIAAICHAAEPVRLTAQPQKFRTFYPLDDPRVPTALKQPGATDRAVASYGAEWYGTAHGVTRVGPKAPPRDHNQYFAGRRYWPDDEVQQLTADQAAGMWVRTKTGVSHIELRPMTLAAKAALFEERVHARHDRHGLVSPSNLQIGR